MFRPTRLLLCFSIAIFLIGCDKPSSSRVSTSFNAGEAGPLAQAPYLLPRCLNPEAPDDLKIAISAVGSEKSENAACSVKTGGKNQDFSLSWTTSAVASTLVRVAEVSVSAGSVYSGDEGGRERLKASFEAFLLALSALEEDPDKNCLNAGDTAVIRDRVASALPLRLDEILSYHYGFDSTNRVIDLQPGMRLRIEQGAYQFISPKDNASAAYVGGGSAYLQVVRGADGVLAFDPFLGAMRAIASQKQDQTTENKRTRMISGAMGLAADGVSRRYARLVYPSQYPTTKNTRAVAADNELPLRVGLLLADRMEELAAATKMYVDDSGCAANERNSVQCFYFSGRSFVVPEILVRIQGVEKYVAVGSTVRDAIDQYAVAPVRQIGNRNAGGFSPVLQRWIQPGLCRGGAGYQSVRILFDLESPVTASRLGQWNMPLLKGDELHW